MKLQIVGMKRLSNGKNLLGNDAITIGFLIQIQFHGIL